MSHLPLLRSVLVLPKKSLCTPERMLRGRRSAATFVEYGVTRAIGYFTLKRGMDSFVESTKFWLSSHPAGWGRVVKVGDSYGGSVD